MEHTYIRTFHQWKVTCCHLEFAYPGTQFLPPPRPAFHSVASSDFHCDNSFDNNYQNICNYRNIEPVSSLGESRSAALTFFLFHLCSSCLGCSALFSNYPFYLHSDLKSHLAFPGCQRFLHEVPDKLLVQAPTRCCLIFADKIAETHKSQRHTAHQRWPFPFPRGCNSDIPPPDSLPPNSPLPMICSSFKSFILRAHPPGRQKEGGGEQ